LIDIAAETVSENKSMLLIPIFYWVLTILMAAGWLFTFFSVISLNDIVPM